MKRRLRQADSEQQRAIDHELYTKRRTTDSNEGRVAAKSCPCLILMCVFDDEAFDGDVVRHMLCPSCAAGWVREVPREHDPANVVQLFEERGVNGPFGHSSE
jgi:hypothetical protein